MKCGQTDVQAGEITRAGGVAPRGAVHIIKQLGLVGLYKVSRSVATVVDM